SERPLFQGRSTIRKKREPVGSLFSFVSFSFSPSQPWNCDGEGVRMTVPPHLFSGILKLIF
ncbi:MAG: hypothetical protein AABZ40_09050, partial [Thermodesulfobacteriota bacterium]